MRKRSPLAHRLTLFIPLLLAASFSSSAVYAQSRPKTSLRERLGSSAAERLLRSSSWEPRMRGIERLGALGDATSIERLLDLLEGENPAFRHAGARLATARALARFADREPVALALAKVLANEKGRAPLSSLLRDTSAMALASSGDARALEILTTTLRQGGLAGESAKLALLAHPPALLLPMPAPDALPPALAALLGELRDPRALLPLRTTLERARSAVPMDEAVAIAAAVALARVGDEGVVEVARAWRQGERLGLKVAGAEVLAILGAKEAGEAIVALLGMDGARARALELSLAHPSPSLAPPLIDIARGRDLAGRRRAIAALGKLEAPEALAALKAMLADPDRADDSAKALALAPGDQARKTLERALTRPETRRRAALAGAVRALVRDDAPSALHEALGILLASERPRDRAAAAFGLSLISAERAKELIGSADPALIRAAALTMSPAELAASVKTATLSAWAEEMSAWAPLAIQALGFRDGPRVRPELERFLTSDQPRLRAHAARGLGLSGEPDAAARLARAYALEAEASVRLAIVEGLAMRKEPQRLSTLELAAALEPDAEARKAARRALDPEAARPVVQDDGRGEALLELAFSLSAEKAPAP